MIMRMLRLPRYTHGTLSPRSKGGEVSCFPTIKMGRRMMKMKKKMKKRMKEQMMRGMMGRGSNATIFLQHQSSQTKAVSRLRYHSQNSVKKMFKEVVSCEYGWRKKHGWRRKKTWMEKKVETNLLFF